MVRSFENLLKDMKKLRQEEEELLLALKSLEASKSGGVCFGNGDPAFEPIAFAVLLEHLKGGRNGALGSIDAIQLVIQKGKYSKEQEEILYKLLDVESRKAGLKKRYGGLI